MVERLENWINGDYLDSSLLHTVRQAYQKNRVIPSVQLRALLNKKVFSSLQRNASRAARKWRHVPNMFIYEQLKPRDTMLDFERFLRSREFMTLLSFVVGKKVAVKEIEWQSFSHRHYTLLHDKRVQEKGVYLFFDLSALWNEAWGGYTSVVRDGQELIRALPSENAATFLTLAGKARQFTKYVNYRAGKHRRIVLVARFK